MQIETPERRLRSRTQAHAAKGGGTLKPKLLIVDDDTAIRQQLFWTLCDEYDVIMAGDFPSAMRHASSSEPVISLLDLHMPPVLDSPEVGLRLLDYIKEQCPSSKVYIVSSEESIETKKACFKQGADGFLSKPLDVEKLLTTMRRSTLAARLEAA
jgi:DNA-binding NtrC family response regulator